MNNSKSGLSAAEVLSVRCWGYSEEGNSLGSSERMKAADSPNFFLWLDGSPSKGWSILTLVAKGPPLPRTKYCTMAVINLTKSLNDRGLIHLTEELRLSLKYRSTTGWSMRFCPIRGCSKTIGILWDRRCSTGPTPESIRICSKQILKTLSGRGINALTWGEWTDPALRKIIQRISQIKFVANQPENNIPPWFCPIFLAILVLCKLNTSRTNLTCDFLEDDASYRCICGNSDVFPRKNLRRQIGGLWGDTLKHIVDVSHWAIYRSQLHERDEKWRTDLWWRSWFQFYVPWKWHVSLTRLTPMVPKGPLKSGVKGTPILIQLSIKAPLSFET